MLEMVHGWIKGANGVVWGPPLIVLLLGAHVFFTVRLGFVQRWVGRGIRLSVSRGEGQGDVSQFGALMTALAATVGTGNIIGVATAIGLGGPGAVLWMWLTGVLGMATKFAEAFLAVHFRQVDERGEMIGGPMEVIHHGLKWPWLAVMFAACALVASFGIGNMVQANSLVHQVEQIAPGVPGWAVGVVLAVVVGAVILGGVKSIARACSVLVPVMVVFYVAGCVVILVLNAGQVVEALRVIVVAAFDPAAAGGGFVGAALAQTIRYGVTRGLFSNESGMGSGGFFAAAARTRKPVEQALVSMTGTFWDTVVICLLTGLVLVSSGAWQQVNAEGAALRGAELTTAAFAHIPWLGPVVLTVALLTFVLSTLFGWSYIGEKSAEYLFGTRAIVPFRMAWVVAVYFGSVSALEFVWDFADLANGLMVVPNLVSLIFLSGFLARMAAGQLEELDGKKD